MTTKLPERRLVQLSEKVRVPEPVQRVLDAEDDKNKIRNRTFNSAV